MTTKLYKFIMYIPDGHLHTVKQAVFDAGAGMFGNYKHCAWQTLGQGQFLPTEGANPAIGAVGTLETVNEWRVETIVPADSIHAVVHAYKTAHPYEVPAYDVITLMDI